MKMFEFYPYILSQDHIHMRGSFLCVKRSIVIVCPLAFSLNKSDVKQEFRASIHNIRTKDL